MSINRLDKSVCLNSQDTVRQICDYLSQHFGLDHFGYIKIFADGTHIGLNTHSEWLQHVYQACFRRYDVFYKTIDAYTSGISLWSAIEDQSSFIGFKQHSKIDHGIVLIEKHTDSCEFYNFATSQNNPQIVNFYLNNLDILWRHVFYFKDQAEHLIKKANSDRLILPRCTLVEPQPVKLSTHLQLPGIRRYLVTIENNSVYLTATEAQCVAYIAKGKRLKEIGALMKLSPRTVEVHLNNAKQKLLCSTTAEMIAKIQHYSNLHRIF